VTYVDISAYFNTKVHTNAEIHFSPTFCWNIS